MSYTRFQDTSPLKKKASSEKGVSRDSVGETGTGDKDLQKKDVQE